uniref:pirin-like C-terminal cupin domain-containing protein n=1 Tax=Methylobacterium sp. B34 TaxID=95563 RepID=UPI0035E3F047
MRAKESARVHGAGRRANGRAAPLWWNFVSSRPERIAQAKEDWRQGRFDTVPNDAEFIPLPEDPQPVRYP